LARPNRRWQLCGYRNIWTGCLFPILLMSLTDLPVSPIFNVHMNLSASWSTFLHSFTTIERLDLRLHGQLVGVFGICFLGREGEKYTQGWPGIREGGVIERNSHTLIMLVETLHSLRISGERRCPVGMERGVENAETLSLKINFWYKCTYT